MRRRGLVVGGASSLLLAAGAGVDRARGRRGVIHYGHVIDDGHVIHDGQLLE